MASKRKNVTAKKVQKQKTLDRPTERNLTVVDVPETGELEIQKKATATSPAKKIRFPKEAKELYQMMPDEFADVQDAIEAVKAEKREVEVFAR